MQNIITWVKNNTQTIYMWIGRLTVLLAVGVIAYIVIRAITSVTGFTFDPLLYILLGVVIYQLSNREKENRAVLAKMNEQISLLSGHNGIAMLTERPKIAKKPSKSPRVFRSGVRSTKR